MKVCEQYCDIELAKVVANGCKPESRVEVARIVRAYRELGWNVPTCVDLCFRLKQKLTRAQRAK